MKQAWIRITAVIWLCSLVFAEEEGLCWDKGEDHQQANDTYPCGLVSDALGCCGRDNWSYLFPKCAPENNDHLSPIDVDTHHLHASHDLEELRFKISDHALACTKATITQDSGILDVDLRTDECSHVFVLKKFEHTYETERIDFVTPSEHTVDGHVFDMEVRFHHTDHRGHALILSVLITAQPQFPSNTFLSAILDAANNNNSNNNETVFNATFPQGSLNFVDYFLPSDGLNYDYILYDGTQTTPGCQDTKWVIMKYIAYASVEQVAQFSTMMTGDNTTTTATTATSHKKGGVNLNSSSSAYTFSETSGHHAVFFHDGDCFARYCHNIFDLAVSLNIEVTGVCIVGLVMFTIVFEYTAHCIDKLVEGYRTANEMVAKVYKELSILGFVSFVSFAFTASCSFDIDEVSLVAFERAHLILFAIAIFYVCSSSVILFITKLNSRHWDMVLCKNGQEAVDYVRQKHSGLMSSSYLGAPGLYIDLGMFFLRHRFILRNNLDPGFDFQKYMKLCVTKKIKSLLDVHVRTWFICCFILVGFYPLYAEASRSGVQSSLVVLFFVSTDLTIVIGMILALMSFKKLLVNEGACNLQFIVGFVLEDMGSYRDAGASTIIEGFENKINKKTTASVQDLRQNASSTSLKKHNQMSMTSLKHNRNNNKGNLSSTSIGHDFRHHRHAQSQPEYASLAARKKLGQDMADGDGGGANNHSGNNHSRLDGLRKSGGVGGALQRLRDRRRDADLLRRETWVPFGSPLLIDTILESASLMNCFFLASYIFLARDSLVLWQHLFIALCILLSTSVLVPWLIILKTSTESIVQADHAMIGEVLEHTRDSMEMRAALVDHLVPGVAEDPTQEIDTHQILAMFSTFDEDGDFTITPKELVKGCHLLNLHLSPEKTRRLLRFLDKDRDRHISGLEMLDMIFEERVSRVDQLIVQAFSAIQTVEEVEKSELDAQRRERKNVKAGVRPASERWEHDLLSDAILLETPRSMTRLDTDVWLEVAASSNATILKRHLRDVLRIVFRARDEIPSDMMASAEETFASFQVVGIMEFRTWLVQQLNDRRFGMDEIEMEYSTFLAHQKQNMNLDDQLLDSVTRWMGVKLSRAGSAISGSVAMVRNNSGLAFWAAASNMGQNPEDCEKMQELIEDVELNYSRDGSRDFDRIVGESLLQSHAESHDSRGDMTSRYSNQSMDPVDNDAVESEVASVPRANIAVESPRCDDHGETSLSSHNGSLSDGEDNSDGVVLCPTVPTATTAEMSGSRSEEISDLAQEQLNEESPHDDSCSEVEHFSPRTAHKQLLRLDRGENQKTSRSFRLPSKRTLKALRRFASDD